MRFAKLLAPILLLATVTAANADPTVPQLTGPIVDLANEIPADQEAKLETEMRDFQKRTGHQFQILTVPDMGGYDIETYGSAVGNTWKIGRAGVDDGIILIHAISERKVRIEVGKGAEAYLTDGLSGDIISNVIIPRFKEKAFAEGMVDGAERIMKEAAITPQQREADEQAALLEQQKNMQAMKDGLASFFGWVFGIGGTGGILFLLYRFLTRGERARRRAEIEAAEAEQLAQIAAARAAAAEKARLAAIQQAEERARREAEAAARRKAMLDAMTPGERQSFLAAEAAQAAEARRVEEERRAAAAEAERVRRIREQKEEDERQERRRREEQSSSSYGYGYGYGSSSGSSSSSSSDSSWGGGGGSFGGGGASGDY